MIFGVSTYQIKVLDEFFNLVREIHKILNRSNLFYDLKTAHILIGDF